MNDMKEIYSNGTYWLFVPVPTGSFDFEIYANEMRYWYKGNYMPLRNEIELPSNRFKIFSTLSEARANEELEREIAPDYPAIYSPMWVFCHRNNINPTQPHIILKRDL